MNEFERRDWEREETPPAPPPGETAPERVQPERMGPAPDPWSPREGEPEPNAPAETVPEPQAEATSEPQAEAVPEAGAEAPAPEPRTVAEAVGTAPGPQEAQRPQPEPASSGEAGTGAFYQGNGGYYAPPQQPQPGSWQGPWHNYQQPGQPGQPGGPRTTGWQQPAPQWGQGPAAGWQQSAPQWGYGPAWNQTPWQAGGYRPQGGPQGNQVPGRWQGTPAPNEPPPKKKHRVLKGFLILLGVAGVLAVVTMAGYGIYAAASGDNPLASPGEGFLPPISHGGSAPEIDLHGKPGTGSDSYDAPDGGLSNSEIFQKVSPSVVLIVAGEGNFYGEQALGSGIIMTEDGYIATNAHLVRNASDFEVVLSEGDSHKAQLVGYDDNNDLAVLKIDGENFPAAEFGDSTLTQVGERVCVIGCPLDVTFRNTLTVGHISALDRSLRVEGRTLNFIQTDAAINPGNSGGPLINAFGQVIGISSAKIILPEYEGMCFAIPISDAMPILRELIANGKVTGRPVLGITVTAVKATEAEYYEIPLGLWVNSINPGADIGAKGVREGDIITHVDGEPVYSVDACSRILSKYKPGDTVSVTVFRRDSVMEDTTFTVDVVLQSS